MDKNEKIYKVTIKETKGVCDTPLFRKMAEKGDLTSIKLQGIINTDVKINGYASCTIETKDKTFDLFYFNTEEYELVSTGSSIFAESVKTYFGDCDSFKLVEIKTKNGKTYKAVPIISMKEESENIEE